MKVIIRYIAVLLTLAVLCCSLGGCSVFESLLGDDNHTDDRGIPDDDAQYEKLPGHPAGGADSYEPVECRYSYGELSDDQKKLYDGLMENVYDIDSEKCDLDLYKMPQAIVDGAIIDAADIRVTLRAIINDNPYLFWLSRTFSHLSSEDTVYTAVQCYSEFSPDELTAMREKLDAQLDEFYAGVPSGLTDYQLEKYAHDYIIERCEYDKSDAAKDNDTVPHSVYGAFVEGLCVCEGYGMAMQLLMNGLGVECVTVTGMATDSEAHGGTGETALHLWNAVKLDGEWYHVDPTWDDQDRPYLRYNYFNLDDSVMYEDHTLSKKPSQLSKEYIEKEGTEDMNIFIPECGSMSYNYFAYECPALTDYDGGKVKAALYQAAGRRDEYFTFYIDPDCLDFDSAMQVLFRESPQYFFGYTDDVNNSLSGYEIDDSNLSYYYVKERCAVTVLLSYF